MTELSQRLRATRRAILMGRLINLAVMAAGVIAIALAWAGYSRWA